MEMSGQKMRFRTMDKPSREDPFLYCHVFVLICLFLLCFFWWLLFFKALRILCGQTSNPFLGRSTLFYSPICNKATLGIHSSNILPIVSRHNFRSPWFLRPVSSCGYFKAYVSSHVKKPLLGASRPCILVPLALCFPLPPVCSNERGPTWNHSLWSCHLLIFLHFFLLFLYSGGSDGALHSPSPTPFESLLLMMVTYKWALYIFPWCFWNLKNSLSYHQWYTFSH